LVSRKTLQNYPIENKRLFCCVSPLHNDGMKYGYARVSPGGKSESVDAQAKQLTKAGCKKVFRDVHVSGAKTDRAQLRRVIEALEAGDVLMVTRLDRLARSTRDLLTRSPPLPTARPVSVPWAMHGRTRPHRTVV
jgi:Resolvase, N terminal domain